MTDDKIDVQVPEDVHLLANRNFFRLGEFFGIKDRQDRLDNQKALEEVLDWAKNKSGSEDIIDVLLHIRSVERMLGSSDEPRLTKLRRYVMLEKEQEHLDKEMSLLKESNEPGKPTP